MGKINYGRVILGGVVAGIISGTLWFFFNIVLMGQRWADTFKALNPSGHNAAGLPASLISLYLMYIVGSILTIWMYAAIRPRVGAGVRIAVLVSVFVWTFGYLFSNVSWSLTGIFSRRLLFYNTLAGLVLIIVGSTAGAALYKEEATEAYPAAAPQATH
jgi:hypothetical protein